MPEDLTVMIVGSGAREHTISVAYEASPQVKKIIVAPGKDFMGIGRFKEVIADGNCKLKDAESILRVALKYEPDLVDVAQDDALAAGTVDLLQKKGFTVFGPNQAAAQIEWDKKWSRNLMKDYGIPHPEYESFTSTGEAKAYASSLYKQLRGPMFIKASGLCLGKGALRAENIEEAVKTIDRMKEFEEAGKVFLVEQCLVGEEFSFYAICDGNNYKILKSAQDNKRAFNFDEGDQTGGMGAISPSMLAEASSKEIEKQLVGKAVAGMGLEKRPYKGILYVGGMMVDGKPFAIEYNVRWGDPECQVVLPSLTEDYLDVVQAAIDGKLSGMDLSQDGLTRVCVVGASKGYPGDSSAVKGKRIFGLEAAMRNSNVMVFGAGIKVEDGKFYANGGRLFSIIAAGENIVEAREKAYDAIAGIHIDGNNLHYRTDIGFRDVERFFKA
jgi:phosphoribosylamine--glycine ligase